MVNFVAGDILKTKAEAIAHGIAPDDHFNQGLALTLKEQWPAMYKDFRHYCHSSHPEEGTLWSWKGAEGPMIINLFTQEKADNKHGHPGKAKESYVNACLKQLAKEVKNQNIKSLAITRLATGVGGLDWNVVQPLLVKHLEGLDIKIFIYEKFQKDLEAQETL